MEKQFETLVVLEEGNKGFVNGPEASCCLATATALI